MSNLILDYLKVLIWPIVLVSALVIYRDTISSLAQKSKLKLSLFGVEIETKISDLEHAVTAAVGGTLSDQQWLFLKEIANAGQVPVDRKTLFQDLKWIRPIRNAGLVLSYPEDGLIEEAKHFALTELGKLVMRARFERELSPSR